MVRIEEKIVFHVPVETAFDAERNISLHAATQGHRGERAVGGVTSGLIEQGEEVEWEAVHFGVTQRLRVRIAWMEKPEGFRDEMVKGAFKSMTHEHLFRSLPDGGTEKTDILWIEAPLGLLGRLAEVLFLGGYMRRFLRKKNRDLKAILESGAEPETAADAEPGKQPAGQAESSGETAVDPKAALQQKAIHWVGRYYIAFSVLFLLFGFATYRTNQEPEFDIKSIVISFAVGLVLSRDRLENNLKTRIRLIYGFWVLTAIDFVVEGPIMGSIELAMAASNTYIFLKPPPRILYYLNNAMYLLIIALTAAGIAAAFFAPIGE
jgi:hypothetical protein